MFRSSLKNAPGRGREHHGVGRAPKGRAAKKFDSRAIKSRDRSRGPGHADYSAATE